MRRRLAKQFGIDREQPPRLLIGGAPQHDTVDMGEMLLRLRDAADAAIDDDGDIRQRCLQPIDAVVVERRDIAVLLRRQSVQPGFSRMHDQRIAPAATTPRASVSRADFRVLVVDADAAFHRDRNFHRALHRGNAVGHQRRLRHQACAEAAVLHPVRRAADIEIDLVIAKILADFGSRREVHRDRAAELQRHRMLTRIESEQPPAVAMEDGARRQHLRIEPRPPRHEAMEDAAMPVGPIHHGRDGKAVGGGRCDHGAS